MPELSDSEKCDALDSALEKERHQIGSDVQSIVSSSKKLSEIPESQALMLSYRQIYSEKIASYRATMNKRKETDLYQKTLRIRNYRENNNSPVGSNHTYSDKQIDQFISSDMAGRTRIIASLESHMDFLFQMIDVLDKLGFAIKNRIEYEKLISP